jgi:hypothetical protein
MKLIKGTDKVIRTARQKPLFRHDETQAAGIAKAQPEAIRTTSPVTQQRNPRADIRLQKMETNAVSINGPSESSDSHSQ